MTTGADWDDVERSLRAAQWTEYPSRVAFRRDMRHRAKTWTGGPRNNELIKASSEDFLRALENNGMCRIDIEE